MTIETKLTYNTPSDHVVTSGLEVVSGALQYKEIAYPTELLWHNFDGSELIVARVLAAKRGTGSIEFFNTATEEVADGRLKIDDNNNCEGIINNFVGMAAANSPYAIAFSAYPNFASVGASVDIITIRSNVDQAKIRLYWSNQGGGVTRLRQALYRSDTGALIEDVVLTTFTFVGLEKVEIGISTNAAGTVKTYIDGTLYRTKNIIAHDFTDCDIQFGGDANNLTRTQYGYFHFLNVDAFLTSIEFPYLEKSKYSLVDEVSDTALPLLANSLVSVAQTTNPAASTIVRKVVKIDGQKFYWNGAAVVTSDCTWAQANTPADIIANAAAFIFASNGSSLGIIDVFLTTDGYTQIKLLESSVVTGFPVPEALVSTCIVYGQVLDNKGLPMSGVVVEADGTDYLNGNSLVAGKAKETTDSNGDWSMQLVETATDSQLVKFIFTYTDVDGEEKTFSKAELTIPNEATKAFNLLV